jgi:hypothetical protein
MLRAPLTEGEAIARGLLTPEGKPAPEGEPTHRTYWKVADLLAASFPEPRWIVPDLLPAGLGLLAGRPKLGKSFLALQLAVAVGSGGMFLGKQLQAGRALYVALEDSPRRMRSRLVKMGAGAGNLTLTFDWPDMAGPGLDMLRDMLGTYKPALVVIDTLARAFSGRTDWDSIGQATGALAGVQELALAHDCAVLFVDHHRKSAGFDSDVIDDVMSSTGKTAVADVVLGLYRKRGERGATLKATGREAEDSTLGLYFDRLTCCWQLAESSDGIRTGSVQADIVAALKDLGGRATVTELAGYLEKPDSNTARELAELVAKGSVRKESADRYAPYVLA